MNFLEGEIRQMFGFRILSRGLCEKLAWAWFRLDDSNHRHNSEDECGICCIRTARQAHVCRLRVDVMSREVALVLL